MGFDKRKFTAAQFAPRTEEVNVSKGPLADFFDKDEKPVFVVRGLTAPELAMANEAKAKNEASGIAIEAIMAKTDHAEKVEELREALGLSREGTPGATIKSIEMIVMGCVQPKLTTNEVVKIGQIAPVEFQILSNTITKLTGMGSEVKAKRRPSGRNKTSKQA